MTRTRKRAEPRFDVASSMDQGHRDYQEDALATDFPAGARPGFAVLADGMGGHAAGDVASRIVVTEVFSALEEAVVDPRRFRADIPALLRAAAMRANQALRAHWTENPAAKGMGATLVATILDGASLWWISVGDSPLFLYRNGAVRRLNEDHSLAPQIDFLVLNGQMAPEVGRNHPDRSCLTSVLGGDRVERIDCGPTPLKLLPDDVIVVASDGLETLEPGQIARILADREGWPAADLCTALMSAVRAAECPEQDNVSFTVIRPRATGRASLAALGLQAIRPLPAVAANAAAAPIPRRLFEGLARGLRRRIAANGKDPG